MSGQQSGAGHECGARARSSKCTHLTVQSDGRFFASHWCVAATLRSGV